jgi:ATPase involved in DNA repair
VEQLNRLARDLDADPRRLEKLEERLFALRDLARKHNVAVDDLAALAERFDGQLARLDDRSGALPAWARPRLWRARPISTPPSASPPPGARPRPSSTRPC